METITIKIEGTKNVLFFVSLLQKFNFIKEITVNKKKTFLQHIDIEEAPIEWATGSPSINDFCGIWKDQAITLNDLRDKGWKRT
jgi:hypothetical protein